VFTYHFKKMTCQEEDFQIKNSSIEQIPVLKVETQTRDDRTTSKSGKKHNNLESPIICVLFYILLIPATKDLSLYKLLKPLFENPSRSFFQKKLNPRESKLPSLNK